YASRMIRVTPCDEPSSFGTSKRSSPRTRRPRRARWHSAALPIPPTPTTIASYRLSIWRLSTRRPYRRVTFSHPHHDRQRPARLRDRRDTRRGLRTDRPLAQHRLAHRTTVQPAPPRPAHG